MKINLPFNYQLRLYGSKVAQRVGICSQSNIEQGKHCLLWDFDNADENKIINSLKYLQKKYNLPTIYVISSSVGNYHAYCFAARTLLNVVHILSDTPEIDLAYLRLGLVRGYYTLRITPHQHQEFFMTKELPSKFQDEISPIDLTVNSYLTSNTGGK